MPLPSVRKWVDAGRVNSKNSSRLRQLNRDQIDMLVRIVREDLGDSVARSQFNESMLLIFENIAGFEALPQRASRLLLDKLWQEYRAACRTRK